MDSSVPLMQNNPSDFGLIYLVKELKIRFPFFFFLSLFLFTYLLGENFSFFQFRFIYRGKILTFSFFPIVCN